MDNIVTVENTEDLNIDEILAASQNEVIRILKIINSQNKKRDEKIKIIEEETEKIKTETEKLKKNTNVICSPFHSKRKRIFSNICKIRVWKLFNNKKNSAEYVLFSYFLFKKIYSDIAVHFDLETWHDLSMENYEEPYSTYSRAKEYASCWNPSDIYINNCLQEMADKRDKGLLSPERCRALTSYLKATNNGEINPFSQRKI